MEAVGVPQAPLSVEWNDGTEVVDMLMCSAPFRMSWAQRL
jgi:hypothetical protein